MRLAIIASHFIQYQAPLWRALAQQPGLDLRVFYLSDHGLRAGIDPDFGTTFQWDVPLDEGYAWELLPGAQGVAPHSRAWRWNLEPTRLVLRNRADVYWRNDYDSPGALAFFYTCLGKRTPLLYRGDTTLLHETRRHARLKRLVLGPVFRYNLYALTVGNHAQAYVRSLGVPQERTIASPYSVDNHYWGRAARDLLPQRDALRERWGLPAERPVVLFCGKLIDKKRPLDLAKALCKLAKQSPVSLLVAGSGEQRSELIAITSQCPELSVRCLGFVNQSKLPEVYAASDIISLPSAGDETWGLVINEAMYFGCVPVVSQRVGCAPDLVAGIGEVHPVGAVDALAHALRRVIDELPERRQRVPARIAEFSLERVVAGVMEGLQRLPKRDYSPSDKES